MNIIIIVVAVTAGVILGGTAIYVYQGKWQSCLTRMFSEEEDKPIVPDSKKIDICAPMPDDENKKFWE